MTNVSSAGSLQTDLFAGTLNITNMLRQEHPLAQQFPVAQVILETDVPHLDRAFDYLVPESLADSAQPGVKVKVQFNGQNMMGYIKSRQDSSEYDGSMRYIDQIISPVSLVSPEIFQLAETLADRYANILPHVLRLAIPTRVVGVEEKFLAQSPEFFRSQAPSIHLKKELNTALFEPYDGGLEFLDDTSSAVPTRAVMNTLPTASAAWEDILAVALVNTIASGQGALAVVPDKKSLERLTHALLEYVDEESFVRLTAHDKPSERYRSFLKVRSGEVSLVIGTRSAAYAPVHRLGLVVCWDDGDANHIEQRAPYCHVRDVLTLRAIQEQCAALFASYCLSSESARLVRTRWASFLGAHREIVRAHAPRVVPVGDDYQLARDPLAAKARIPHLAFETARAALKRGPVLVQVARSGYIPSLSCQRCRMPVRCPECRGSVSVTSSESIPNCTWCGRLIQQWCCPECGSQSWRSSAKGVLRTAEELGRAFPGVPIISSGGDHVRSSVGSSAALVIATSGAEPVAEGGYSAALLLDADSMLHRDSLRAPEVALRSWFNASALVRSAAEGGTVICTASQSWALESLVRWDSPAFALRELSERQELSLPPAVRTAAITGTQRAVESFVSSLSLPDEVIVRGPLEVCDHSLYWSEEDEESNQYRTILFFSFGIAPEVTHHLRTTRASQSIRQAEPVQIRCDGLDIF
ncbi:primosomal protein N' [Rothia sp. CCM 9419]|uniref:primosomal protein N' n=1 Tax=Rothia sp. CCM 9419 TaxID=3402662 RepID=UPI003AE76048